MTRLKNPIASRNEWMPKVTEYMKKKGYLILCGLIPSVLVLLLYVARGLYPIENGSVLVLDLNGQYVWFFEALRNFVRGDASALYSFSRQLGGEFLGIYAYYLASPFSYLLCLFPKTKMLEGLLFMFLVKTFFCGWSFGYYIHKTHPERKPYAAVTFSVLYALCSYAIVMQHNTMWIDAMMWLPLITLGIEELIRNGKYKLYTGLLALTLFSNYYIGYMVCIYCLVYFFVYYFGHSADAENNPTGEKHHFLLSLVRIAVFSLLAIGIAALLLLSAYYSLNFGKTTFSVPQWDWNFKIDLTELLYKLLPGSYDTVRPAGYPIICCGALTLLLLPVYFFSKKYKPGQKIAAALFILFFILSFSIVNVDLIWHGFQAPNWLNYRYSFMLCFFLCVLSCRALCDVDAASMPVIAGTGGLIALFCVYLQKYTDNAYVTPDNLRCIWFTLILIGIYLAVLGIRKNTAEKNKSFLSLVLLCVVIVETVVNGLIQLDELDQDVVFSGYTSHNGFVDKTRPIVEEVQEKDPSFYRMEKTFFRTVNDNMALNMRGLSGSSSTLNRETIMFLDKMGYVSKSHWSKYVGGTPVNDSLMGVKYIVSPDVQYPDYYEPFATDPLNGYTAYLNPYALSIAYGVSDDILSFPLGYLGKTEEEDAEETEEEPEETETMNKLIAAIKSGINKVFDIEEILTASEYTDEYHSPFTRLNAIITAMLGEEETVKVFKELTSTLTTKENVTERHYVGNEIGYSKNDTDDPGSITYAFYAPEDGTEIYFYLPTIYPREIKLELLDENDESFDFGTFNGSESSCIKSLGKHDAGTLLAVTLTTGDGSNAIYKQKGEESFYYIDRAVFENVMERLGRDQLTVESSTEDSIRGTFTASDAEELVLTTIPYDNGWKIYVDGKRTDNVKALGSLVSFYVRGDAGQTHEIRLVYRPRVFTVGLIVSSVSLVLFLTVAVLESRIRKIRILRGLVGTIVPEPAPLPESADGTVIETPDEGTPPAESATQNPPSPDARADAEPGEPHPHDEP